jgi:putative membrane protein
MSRLLASTALAGVLLAAPAFAQSVTQPSPAQIAAPDQKFVHEAAIGGKAEVELGKIAERNGESKPVKDFGQQMVTDHSRINDQLAAWAKKNDFRLPDALDSKHQADADRLGKLKGGAFDRAYIADMVQDHQQDAQAFQQEAQTTQNPELKQFAQQTLTVVQHHLQMAQRIDADMKRSAAPQASASQDRAMSGSSRAPGSKASERKASSSKAGDNSADQLNAQELKRIEQP